MDDPVIAGKLDTIQKCVERIRAKTPSSLDQLIRDVDAQDIIAVNLERAVQACVDVAARLLAQKSLPPPETMAASFDGLVSIGLLPTDVAQRMKKAVGFRNIAVHAYKQIDWAIVYALITMRLDDFNMFVRRILELKD